MACYSSSCILYCPSLSFSPKNLLCKSMPHSSRCPPLEAPNSVMSSREKSFLISFCNDLPYRYHMSQMKKIWLSSSPEFLWSHQTTTFSSNICSFPLRCATPLLIKFQGFIILSIWSIVEYFSQKPNWWSGIRLFSIIVGISRFSNSFSKILPNIGRSLIS